MTITASPTVTIRILPGGPPPQQPPVWATQPQTSYQFFLGQATTVPFGTVTDINNDPITVALVPPAQGFSLTIAAGGQVTLQWDGAGIGATQTLSVRGSADDGA